MYDTVILHNRALVMIWKSVGFKTQYKHYPTNLARIPNSSSSNSCCSQNFCSNLMATNRDNDVGRLAVCNATPFVWKLSENKKHRMPVWQFPRSVNPGETVTARVKFGKDGGGNGGPTGEATYRVGTVCTFSFRLLVRQRCSCHAECTPAS